MLYYLPRSTDIREYHDPNDVSDEIRSNRRSECVRLNATMGFSLKQSVQEKNTLWAIAFSPERHQQKAASVPKTKPNLSDKPDNTNHYHSFATCGGRRVTIYDYETERLDNRKINKDFRKRQSYTSTHTNEDFYAVTFGQRHCDLDANGKEEVVSKQVVCVAGACAIILILDVDTGRLHATLKGSIGYISDLKSISCGSGDRRYNLLCSATRDQVRLWNLDTLANVCIFAGEPHGHIGDVLSVAWHPTGSRIVSGGGDPTDGDEKHSNIVANGKNFQICIWNVFDSPRLQEAIQASSYLPDFVDNRSQFNPHVERFALSVHNDVHANKVDCVAWLGDLVLSKSIFDEIILWQPLSHCDSSGINTGNTTKSSIAPIKIFQYDRNDYFYFVRFGLTMDGFSSLLAVGNSCGQVYLWDLDDVDNDGHSALLKTWVGSGKAKKESKRKSAIIRGLAFSPDGEILVGCDADGFVFRWEKHRSSRVV